VADSTTATSGSTASGVSTTAKEGADIRSV
jgi:hypothetical protein